MMKRFKSLINGLVELFQFVEFVNDPNLIPVSLIMGFFLNKKNVDIQTHITKTRHRTSSYITVTMTIGAPVIAILIVGIMYKRYAHPIN